MALSLTNILRRSLYNVFGAEYNKQNNRHDCTPAGSIYDMHVVVP